MNEIPAKLRENLTRVIVGKDDTVEMLIAAVLAGGHILLEDAPGTGKTTLALALSRSLGLRFRRLQLTPDTVASDITGYSAYDQAKESFVYHPGAAMTDLLLADELNRTSGKTQSALLEAMEEGRLTVDGITYDLPRCFTVIATQNPVGAAGTSAIPLSQLDRFMVQLHLGAPDKESLKRILADRAEADPLDGAEQVCTGEELEEIRAEIRKVSMSDEMTDYVCDIWQAIADSPHTETGISPRGALALCRIARAGAYLDGRDYVVPSDIRACFLPVCAHRLVLTREAKAAGKTAEQVLSALLKAIPCPDNKGL
ncbi:MoxR family ATPase [Ruminococcus sp.]|uniref:AAA family ATPase n=1 Tax=Ruminococcus sp. TaxID=41978 RepID=UPI0025D46C07|nr:MoxR family ATPase [Ruminococcus sp.]MBQ8965570.1 MoxR family ATPase [Ruminococcus sp.]